MQQRTLWKSTDLFIQVAGISKPKADPCLRHALVAFCSGCKVLRSNFWSGFDPLRHMDWQLSMTDAGECREWVGVRVANNWHPHQKTVKRDAGRFLSNTHTDRFSTRSGRCFSPGVLQPPLILDSPLHFSVSSYKIAVMLPTELHASSLRGDQQTPPTL